MKPSENQYVIITLRNLIQIEGSVKHWSNEKAVIYSKNKDLIIIQNVDQDVLMVKIPSSTNDEPIIKKQELDEEFDKILDSSVEITDQSLKAKKLADLRLEQSKLDKLIISSKLKNHEISNRKPVTYDQLGIFKKQQSK